MRDLTRTEDVVLGQLLGVHVRCGGQGAEGDGPPGEEDVGLGHEDVQVLGVHDDDEEDGDGADLGQHEGRLQRLDHAVAEPREDVADDVGCEGPVAVREVAQLDLRTPVEQQGGHDEEDQAQDEPRLVAVRAVEARGAVEALGRLTQADGREDGDGYQHGHRHEVLEEPEPTGVTDERQREVLAQQ